MKATKYSITQLNEMGNQLASEEQRVNCDSELERKINQQINSELAGGACITLLNLPPEVRRTVRNALDGHREGVLEMAPLFGTLEEHDQMSVLSSAFDLGLVFATCWLRLGRPWPFK